MAPATISAAEAVPGSPTPQRVFLAAVAMRRRIAFFWRRAAMMGNDQLALRRTCRHAHTFVEQATGFCRKSRSTLQVAIWSSASATSCSVFVEPETCI